MTTGMPHGLGRSRQVSPSGKASKYLRNTSEVLQVSTSNQQVIKQRASLVLSLISGKGSSVKPTHMTLHLDIGSEALEKIECKTDADLVMTTALRSPTG